VHPVPSTGLLFFLDLHIMRALPVARPVSFCSGTDEWCLELPR
jgi:hypothetical protein